MEFLESPKARNISNSEVTTFLSCRRQYEYAFVLELAPKDTATPLSRGTLFHYAMELYWRARLAGKLHEEAYQYGMEAFGNPSEPTSIEVIMETQFLWTRYMNHHAGFPTWRPVGTEEQIDTALTPNLNMTIKYDFYFEDLTDGKYYILDYKLAYDFWQPEDHDLNAQMPKYIATLQGNGLQCDGGYLEEIRTRKISDANARDPKNLFRRTRYVPSRAKKSAVLAQHIGASFEIEKFRNLPEAERKKAALPVLNKHGACKYCNFKDLCNSELEGKTDLSVDIRTGYTRNTYGYNFDE